VGIENQGVTYPRWDGASCRSVSDASSTGQKVTYRFLPHTADIKVAIEAASFEELLADATVIMRGLLAGEGGVEKREERRVAATGADASEVLLHYLQELLYLFDTEGFLPAIMDTDRFTGNEMAARVGGEVYDPARHEHQPEVKAVTRHGLRVERRADAWYAEVLFDV
jgi:SHS2 domain-containing protein